MRLLPPIQVHVEPLPAEKPWSSDERIAKPDFSATLVGPDTKYVIRHGLGCPVYVQVFSDPSLLHVDISHPDQNTTIIENKTPFIGRVIIFKS